MSSDSSELADHLMEKIKKIVDAEFGERILRQSENDSSIEVTDVVIKAATVKGDNYASDMFRAIVEFVRSNDEKGAKEKKQMIVKVEPMTEGLHKELISKSSLFSTEIMMMSDTLAKMNQVLAPGKPLNGRCLFTQKADPTLLVIEDLAPLGFRMADRQAGLDTDHCLLAIRGLARFHASSVALCEKEPNQRSRYTRGMFHSSQPQEFHHFFIQGAKQLAREVANWPELGPEYSGKIVKFADTIYERGCAASACRQEEFNVINHGDFWVNNMLFEYGEDSRPVGHMFVDFQLCLYSSPAIDLQYFFNTSLTDDTLLENEESLLKEYIHTLALTMSRCQCRAEPPSLRELRAMLRERAIYGMIASFTVLPMMLVDKSEAKDLNEIMIAGEEYNNPAYRSALFRKAMIRRLPKFHQMGLLD